MPLAVEDFDALDRRLEQLVVDLRYLKGRSLLPEFLGASLLFDHLVPEPVALSRDELNALLRAEVTAGRMERGDAIRVLRTDIVFRSATRTPGIYLAVEVSWNIDPSDVARAAERASLLAKTGQQTRAAVAGRRIQPDVLELATRRGVAVVIDEAMDDRPRIAAGV